MSDTQPKPPPYGVNPPPHVPGNAGPAPGPPPQYGFAAQQGFVPPPPPPGPVQVTVVGAMQLGPYPSTLQCPTCHMVVQSKIKSEPSTATHLMALFICLFLLWPCACIPYCAECGYSVNHYCPSCNTFLGTYKDL